MPTPSGPDDQTPPPDAGERGESPPPRPEYPPNPAYAAFPPYPPPYPGAAMPPSPYGPPAPGMPAYPQPPYPPPYGAYPGYPPPLPRNNSNRTLWIVLSVVGGVLLLACLACGCLVFFLVTQVANNPVVRSSLALSSFCDAELTQDYNTAYDLFSSNLKSQISQSRFVQDSQNADATMGPVTSCVPSSAGQSVDPSSSATSETFRLTITRGFEAGSAGTTGGTSSGSTPGTATGTVTRTTPASATPSGTPSSGTPSSGTPSSGTPSSGTPSPGTTPSPTAGSETTTAGSVTLVKENTSWKIDNIASSLGLL